VLILIISFVLEFACKHIEGPSGKRGHVPFWILSFPKNGIVNFRHVNISSEQ